MTDTLMYADACLAVVLALAQVGIALGVVRPTSPRAAFMLAGAGVVDLLTSCAGLGIGAATRTFGEGALLAWRLVVMIAVLLSWGLLVGAAASLAAEVAGRRGRALAGPDLGPGGRG